MYQKTKPIISIHIPKCGGQSLTKVLRSWYGSKFYPHYKGPKSVPKKVQLNSFFGPKKGLCIHGHFNNHFGMGVDHYYPGSDQLITFLRDPLEMAISTFFYNQKLIAEGKFVQFEQARDIDEHLETRSSFLNFFLPIDINKDNYQRILDERFLHIGIIEDYQYSLNTLAEKIGKPKVDIEHVNTSKRFQSRSETSIRKFKEKSVFEYKVYDFAVNQLNSTK